MWRFVLILIFALFLLACDGSPSTDEDTEDVTEEQDGDTTDEASDDNEAQQLENCAVGSPCLSLSLQTLAGDTVNLVQLAESPQLVAELMDSDGDPIENARLHFDSELLTISPSTGDLFSDAQGLASVDITHINGAGFGTATVTADFSVDGDEVQLQTTTVYTTFSTGVADQDSMTLSFSMLAPESDFVGTVVNVSAYLADQFNNVVNDGTVVNFTTEGGAIDSNCVTEQGVCTVEWRAQNPYPEDRLSTIMAYAEGVESFTDVDNNAVFSDADTFDDLEDPFRDDDLNGLRDPGDISFDYNEDGVFSADGLYNGELCEDTTGRCAEQQRVYIFKNAQISMSGSDANIQLFDDTGALIDPATGFSIAENASLSLSYVVTPQVGGGNNSMPSGTSIVLSAGLGAVLTGDVGVVVPTDRVLAQTYSIVLEEASLVNLFTLLITVTTPAGIVTTAAYPVTVI